MKRGLILGFLLFFIAEARFSFALDWKALHERADKISLDEALSELELEASSVDKLYILGLVYLNRHKNQEARDIFQKIIMSEPQLAGAKWGLAEVLRRQHRIEDSERILQEIVKDHPSFSPAYISLAYIKYTQMDFEQCVVLALKVIKQGRESVDLSNYTRAYLLLAGAKGMIASRGGPLSKVINGIAVLPNLKKAEMLQPDSPAVLFGLGSFYFLAPGIAGGDIRKAQDYLERAVELDPLFADAYVRLAQVYKSQGKTEKYKAYLEKARNIDPKNALLEDFEKGKCRFHCVTVKE